MMTVEHRLAFGLSDVVAITCECRNEKCRVRLSVAPETLLAVRLSRCPSCGNDWLPADRMNDELFAHPMTRLLAAIKPTLANEEELGCRVLFEFTEPAAPR